MDKVVNKENGQSYAFEIDISNVKLLEQKLGCSRLECLPILHVFNGSSKDDFAPKWKIEFQQKIATKYLITMISQKGDKMS